MKSILLIISSVSLFFLSCSEGIKREASLPVVSVDHTLVIPAKEIEKSALDYNNKKSLWTLNEQVYSGYAISHYSNGTLKERFGILDGKKQNEAIRWYPDGHYKHLENYHRGKLHGEKKTWSADSSQVLVAQLNYYLGKVHGEQKKWYPTGELFKKLNLNMGKEEGIQQAFRKNGDLFANYEARAGRIFGLKRAALCFGLENENIKNEN